VILILKFSAGCDLSFFGVFFSVLFLISNMGDLDDFFAKKDKKKKGGKKFSKANTDVLAKNLQETERYVFFKLMS
jgi:hypothetical protein